MSVRQFLILLILPLFFAFQVPAGLSNSGTPKLKIIGTIIDYDGSVSRALGTAEGVKYEILLVRVDKVLNGKEKSNYIRVNYVYGYDIPPLPDEIFKGIKQWSFELKRDTDYDAPLREMLYVEAKDENGKELPPVPVLVRVPGAENEKLPTEDTIIPTYKLISGKLKEFKKTK